MVPALLVKNYLIRLLKKVWHILLVLCTWYISCSIQLEAHEDNWNINEWKRTEATAGVWAKKKESSGAGTTLMKTKSSRAGAVFMKRRAPGRSCDIFTTAPQPCNNSNCSRAHGRHRVKLQQINCISNNL